MRQPFCIVPATSPARRQRRNVAFIPIWLLVLLLSLALITPAVATENASSVYPVGAETVLPGVAPPPGASMLSVFTNGYESNVLAGANGRSMVPGFHLSVAAVAIKFTHNWGVRVFGGMLISNVGIPFLHEHLDSPFGKGFKTGFSNPAIEPLAVAYRRGSWNWWYGYDVFTPSFEYQKNALINIGQHNYAGAPAAAFTYLNRRTGTEISSRGQYIVNGENKATHYRSGNELVWEYDAMQNFTKRAAVGINGYYYQQTTEDLQYGVMAGSGNRGRDLAIGPEFRYSAGKLLLIAKYQRDTLVHNKTIGNSFWLELGVPIGRPRE